MTSEVLADGNVVQFGYDAVGRLTSITPPGRPAHQFVYSPVGLLQQYTPPPVAGGGTNGTLYAYDADRNLTDVLRPDGGLVHLDYDAAGRATTVALPTGETIALAYDPTTGKLTSATGPTPGQALAYGYDGFLLTDTTWSGQVNGNVHRTYDNFFRLATETVNGGSAVTYGYDADGLVTSVGAMTLVPSPVNGLLTGTTLGGVTDSYTYDAYGQVKTYTAKFGSTVLYAYTIDTRDALGRITQKTETNQGTTHVYQYGYHPRGWLTDVSTDGQATGHYEYDANGNRTVVQQNGVTQSAYFDDQDRLLAQGTLQFTYTTNGEVRTKTDTATGQVTTYTYDALGNLVKAEFAPALPSGTSVIDYVIDGMGRRVGRKVNGTLVKGWLYRDGLRIVAETDGNGNVVSRFVYADGAGAEEPVVANLLTRMGLPRLTEMRGGSPVYVVRGSTVYRVLSNHLGSVLLAVDSSAGPPPFESLSYDEWGKVTADSSPGALPMAFAGGVYDSDTGLVRFGARDYSAEIARWTSKDSVRFLGGANLYEYAANDPINNIDSDGLDWTSDLQDMDELHRNRNKYNKCPPHPPAPGPTGPMCTENGDESGDDRTWNQDPKCPVPLPGCDGKWRASDGSECAYDDNGNLIPNAGSYNYCPNPYTLCHIFADFLPHFIFGGNYVNYGK